jgi:hypothetical protein
VAVLGGSQEDARQSRIVEAAPAIVSRAVSPGRPCWWVPVQDEQGGVVREDGAPHCKASCGIKFGAFRLRIVQACRGCTTAARP